MRHHESSAWRWLAPRLQLKIGRDRIVIVAWWRVPMYRRLRYAVVAAAVVTPLLGLPGHGAERPRAKLEGAQKRHQILLLLSNQFVTEHEVEELNRVVQRQQALVM
jgi:hypothetical protein